MEGFFYNRHYYFGAMFPAGGPVKIYVNGRELEAGVPARWGWKLNGTGKKI